MAVVLMLRALGLGDLLTGVPAMRALVRAFPTDRAVLAAPAPLARLAAFTGAVDEFHPTPGLGALHWTGPPPDLAVNLHGKGPQSIAELDAVRPGLLWTHWHPDYPERFGPRWRDDRHETVRWCEMLETYGIETDPSDLDLPHPPWRSPAPGAVVVHPGAGYPARRWPPERFAAVARELAASGHRVVVTGSREELGLARSVARDAGLSEEDVLAGRTGLEDLAALVASARLVVCGDTGVGHLATAFGTPSVLLFGPTPPHRWGPPPDRPQHVVLWVGDVGDPFAPAPDAGLLLIGTERVLAAVEGLVGGGVLSG